MFSVLKGCKSFITVRETTRICLQWNDIYVLGTMKQKWRNLKNNLSSRHWIKLFQPVTLKVVNYFSKKKIFLPWKKIKKTHNFFGNKIHFNNGTCSFNFNTKSLRLIYFACFTNINKLMKVTKSLNSEVLR